MHKSRVSGRAFIAGSLSTNSRWINTAGGTWATAADWSGGHIPSATSNVLISTPGSYTVTIGAPAAAASITVSGRGADLAVDSLLKLTGTLAATAGTVTLANGGTITGGTLLADAGGAYVVDDGGTLSGVDLQGTLTLRQMSGYLDLSAGFTAKSNGTVDVTGQAEALTIHGYTTLNGVALTYDVPPENYAEQLELISRGNVAQTFTIGRTASLNVLSGLVVATGDNFAPDILKMSFVNDGTINVSGSTSQLDLAGQMHAFTNTGRVDVSNGGTLIIFASSISNAGTFSVSGAQSELGIYFRDFATQPAWQDTGTVEVSNQGTLNLYGLTSLTEFASIDNQGGTIAISGTLDGPGTLALASLTGSLAVSGAISHATILDPTGDANVWLNGALLDHVTYEGTLNLDNTQLNVQASSFTGAGGSGVGTILLSGGFSELIQGDLLDNVSIEMGNGNHQDDCNLTLGGGVNGGTYVWGPGFTLTGAGGQINNFGIGDTILNEGIVNADFAGGRMDLYQYEGSLGGDGSSNFINSGTISASNSDSFIVSAGDINDTFSNSGLLSASSGGTIDIQQTHIYNTGLISASGSQTVLTIGTEASAGSTLIAAWTNAGSLSVAGGAVLNVTGVLGNNAGGILAGGTFSVGQSSRLVLPGAPITDDSATIQISGSSAALFTADGSGTTNLASTLQTISAAGTLSLSAGAIFHATEAAGPVIDDGTIKLSTAVFNAASLQITGTGQLFGSGAVSGPVVNVGMINALGKLSFLGHVVNNGTIAATSGQLILDKALAGSGTLSIGAGATAVLASADSNAVSFQSPNAHLALGDLGGFTGTITDFLAQDTLDLLKVSATGLSYSNGILTISNGTGVIASIHIDIGASSHFKLVSDHAGGSIIRLT